MGEPKADKSYLEQTPEYGPEQSSFEEDEAPEVVETEKPAEEAVSSEPESTEVVGTEKAGPKKPDTEIDKDPDLDDTQKGEVAELKKIVEDLNKTVKKQENRQQYLQRKIDRQSKAEQEKSEADDERKAFKAELDTKYPEPKEDDFDTIADFEDAKIQNRIDRGVAEGIFNADQVKKTAPKEEGTLKEQVTKTVDRGAEKYDDFMEVVFQEHIALTNEIIDAVINTDDESVDPEDVFYYMGKHPTETKRISRMNPDQAGKAIDKIVSNLADAKKKAGDTPATTETSEKVVSGDEDTQTPKTHPKSKIKDVSSASDPITPTDQTVVITKDPEKMNQAEYEKWRLSQGVS